MKVGILGSGDVGKTFAAGFLKHGHVTMTVRNSENEIAATLIFRRRSA